MSVRRAGLAALLLVLPFSANALPRFNVCPLGPSGDTCRRILSLERQARATTARMEAQEALVQALLDELDRSRSHAD